MQKLILKQQFINASRKGRTMQNNIEDKTKKHCTGCGACVAACPVNAISYKLNEEGFFQAFLDQKKCIHCGKCKKVCSKFIDLDCIGKELKEGILYAAQSKNKKVVQTCTSGGIAYEISRYGIENGYQIIGTIYNYEKNIAETIVAKTKEDIELLKGSKYIQSSTEEALQKLKKIAKEDVQAKFIIFGTPCQLVGVSQLIVNENIENEMIKIDLFCHGVPSYLVWDNYRQELKEKHHIASVQDICFRDKTLGWHNYCIRVKERQQDHYFYQNSEKCTFYQAFFDTILYNKPCFDCIVRKQRTVADIRLGDFWGKRYANRKDGVSAVVVMTSKGKKLLEEIEEIHFQEQPIQECLENQSTSNYLHQEIRDKYIKILQKNKNLKTTIKAYRKELPLKLKIKNHVKNAVSKLPIKIRLIAKDVYHKTIYK